MTYFMLMAISFVNFNMKWEYAEMYMISVKKRW